MLDPQKANIFSADIDLVLEDRERAVLASALQQEWFDILQKIMEDVVRHQNRLLVNVDPADPFYETIVANRHRVAHAVGRFYIDLMTRLKDEFNIQAYNAAKLGTVENPENPNSEDFD